MVKKIFGELACHLWRDERSVFCRQTIWVCESHHPNNLSGTRFSRFISRKLAQSLANPYDYFVSCTSNNRHLANNVSFQQTHRGETLG